MTDDPFALEMDEAGYPTEDTLAAIRAWQLPYGPLFDRLLVLWRWESYFVRASRSYRGVRTYHVHTGGWSGHEKIIGAMQDNHLLWAICWVQSQHGGHYIFRVPVRWPPR